MQDDNNNEKKLWLSIINHDFNHYGTTEEEEVADHNAFWTLYSDLEGNERTTALLGILCALVSLIFVNPSLEDDGIHPLPIERVFYFYDIVKEEIANGDIKEIKVKEQLFNDNVYIVYKNNKNIDNINRFIKILKSQKKYL